MLGLELIGYQLLVIIEWLIVFILNVVPAFAPPTWAVLSFFNISRPQNIFALVLIGVSASVAGRYLLAKLSYYFTSRFSSPEKKREFVEIEKKISKKGKEKFIFTFIYSLTPLPSNALFIAFGATKTRLFEILSGFALGRTISYLFLIFTTEKVFSSIGETFTGNATLLTILIEVVGIAVVLVFLFFDWTKLIRIEGLNEKKPKGKRWAHKK